MANKKKEVLMAFERFNLVEGKSEKQNFIEGFISTTDPDKVHDIITDAGQDDLVEQIKILPITMDEDHESFREKNGKKHERAKNLFPVAKVVEVKRVRSAEKNGTFVKALLNNDHPNADMILKNIKKGFLHSFSIAYQAVKALKQKINDVNHRILDKVELFNIGITGLAVNPKATFDIVTKSFTRKMVEENENKKKEENQAELKSITELKSGIDAELKSFKNTLEGYEKKIAELKSLVEKNKKDSESISELKSSTDTELKSLKDTIEKQKEEIVELKSTVEKLGKSPILKAAFEGKSEVIKKTKELGGDLLQYAY